MNKTLLENELQSRKVSKDMYCLNGGLPNEAYCLNLNNKIWEVYYSERGTKTGLKSFKTESEACNYLIKLLIK